MAVTEEEEIEEGEEEDVEVTEEEAGVDVVVGEDLQEVDPKSSFSLIGYQVCILQGALKIPL